MCVCVPNCVSVCIWRETETFNCTCCCSQNKLQYIAVVCSKGGFKLKVLISYHSWWAVQDIRHCVMFGYQYQILANHWHTDLWTVKLTVAQPVTVLFYRHKRCFNKQLPNKDSFTALSYLPLYQRILCQYTYRIYLHISCTVRYWSHHRAVPSLWPPYQFSLYSATLLLVSPHCSHCAVTATQSHTYVPTLCTKPFSERQ